MSKKPFNFLAEAKALHAEFARNCEEMGVYVPELWLGPPVYDAYRTGKDFDIDTCPKCKNSIFVKIVGVNVICDDGISSNFGTYASICEACKVCVIDEDALDEDWLEDGAAYVFPLGIFPLQMDVHEDESQFAFKTFEGREFMFVRNEEGIPVSIKYRTRELSVRTLFHDFSCCTYNFAGH